MAERVEVDVDVQLAGQRDAGLDGVLVVFFGDRPGGVDIKVQVGVVFRTDRLAHFVEVVRVPPVGFLERHVDGLVAVLAPVDRVHLLENPFDDGHEICRSRRGSPELDVGRPYSALRQCALIGGNGRLRLFRGTDSRRQLLNLVGTDHVQLHGQGRLDDFPLVLDLLAGGFGVSFHVDHDQALGANQFAQVEGQNAHHGRIGLLGIVHDIGHQGAGERQGVVVVAVLMPQQKAFCQVVQIQLLEVREHLVGLRRQGACNLIDFVLQPDLEVVKGDGIGEVYAQCLCVEAEGEADEELVDVALSVQKRFGGWNDVGYRRIDHGGRRQRHVVLDSRLYLERTEYVHAGVVQIVQKALIEQLFDPRFGLRILLLTTAVQYPLGNFIFGDDVGPLRHADLCRRNLRLKQRRGHERFQGLYRIECVLDVCRIERRQLYRLLVCDRHCCAPFRGIIRWRRTWSCSEPAACW